MDRLVSLGVNNNPKYIYYLPLVKWAWQQFGWETFVSFVGDENKLSEFVENVMGYTDGYDQYFSAGKYESSTVAQTCRMYAVQFYPENCLMMTSDADILPLSNYWQPKEDEITCYGRDLSNEHFPMCFVAMDKSRWTTVMNGEENPKEKGISWDLDFWYPKAKNKWVVDQNILTDRLNNFHPKTLVNRGIDHKTHYPIGRVDRSSWSLNHERLIDAHLPHDILTNEDSFKKVLNLLHHVWPKENWNWFVQYHKEFKKLL